MAGDLRSQILAIQEDKSLTDQEKAVKRQALLSGKWQAPPAASPSPGACAFELPAKKGVDRQCVALLSIKCITVLLVRAALGMRRNACDPHTVGNAQHSLAGQQCQDSPLLTHAKPLSRREKAI